MSKFTTLKPALRGAALTALLSLGALSTQALAMGPHHGGPGMPGHGPGAPMMMEQELDLVDASEAQRKQVQDIFAKAHDELRKDHETMRKLHDEQRKLLVAPSIDAAAVEAKRAQIDALQQQFSKRITQAMIEAARVLTPEQRAKLADRIAKREARRAEFRKDAASAPRRPQP